jgi:hypothetical protein
MVSPACKAGEDPRLDLVQSYARHQCCTGQVDREDRKKPQRCKCPCHSMKSSGGSRSSAAGSRAPASGLAVARLVLVAAAVLALVVVMFR